MIDVYNYDTNGNELDDVQPVTTQEVPADIPDTARKYPSQHSAQRYDPTWS